MALYFEDFEEGREWVTPGRTITEADVVHFAGLSGDFNPLHTDAVFAAGTPYGRRIAHGVLGLAVATGLRQRTGVLDGSVLALLEIRQWRFVRPVFIGDTVHVRWRVVEKRPTSRPDRGVLVQQVQLWNQDGQVVQEGILVSLVRRRTPGEAGASGTAADGGEEAKS